MEIVKSKTDLKTRLDSIKEQGQTIGFVPTMGALHAGHVSLIAAAKKQNDVVVCSIFVNPTQFNDKNDYNNYPLTVAQDVERLLEADCDLLFLPPVSEIYPQGIDHLEQYDFGYLETVLDGAARPGHFQGVGQVVSRLIEAVLPTDLYLGQKDYQQCAIIRELLDLKSYNLRLTVVPTMREADGLAMSSRNRRLTPVQRASAPLIYQCLVSIEAQQKVKPFEIVRKECLDILEKKGFKPDYISLVDADTLELLTEYNPKRNLVALIAAFLGDIRLIDNLPLKNIDNE